MSEGNEKQNTAASGSVGPPCSADGELPCNVAFQKHMAESQWGDNVTQSARFDFWEMFQAGFHYGNQCRYGCKLKRAVKDFANSADSGS